MSGREEFDKLPYGIWLRTRFSEGCWLWLGATMANGYGRFAVQRRARLVHRVAYEHLRGKIPDGLTLDHKCRQRNCINPDHLEPVTNRDNILRGGGVSARNARKTHCDHGHEFTPANTYVNRGQRLCRLCRRDASRKLRAQRKAA